MHLNLPLAAGLGAILLFSGAAGAREDTAAPPPPGAPAHSPDTAPGSLPGDATVRAVTIPSSSGGLQAIYRPSPRGKGRSIMLIAANGYPASSMDPLAETLRQAGFSVLSIENPGLVQGRFERGGVPYMNPHSNRTSSIERLVKDADQGLVFLDGEPSADTSSVALVGVGLGANLAAFLSGRDDRVRALAFVSPGSSCSPSQTLRSVESVGETPALLIEKPGAEGFRPSFETPGHGGRTIVDFVSQGDDVYGSFARDSFQTRTIVTWLIERYPPGEP